MDKHPQPAALAAVTAGGTINRRRLLAGGAATLALALPGLGGARESVAQRLEALGITLPEIPPPVANYVPYRTAGGLVFCAGQIAFRDGELLHPGKVPGDVSIEDAQAAARQCAINLLAAVSAALDGDLQRVEACVRLQGFVASADDFTAQPQVINGASDLMVAVLGDAGRHSRLAVGVNTLPLNACVEVSAIFAVGPA
ncbi:MAG: RidA family protein [Candidatus Competibacterales bacterium]